MEQNLTGAVFVDEMEVIALKGLYDLESVVPNRFKVSAKLVYDRKALKEGEFVDYSILANIISDVMHGDEGLLEKCAEAIVMKSLEQWHVLLNIHVKISKMNPAFSGSEIRSVGVETEWQKK